MEPLVFILILVAAICHASWNAITKNSGDPWLRMAIGLIISSSICFFLIFIFPLPNIDSWMFLFLSGALHQIYFVGVCLGYRLGDLSQVYPLQRGIAPLLVAIGAFVFADEVFNLQGFLGFIIICISIVFFALANNWRIHNPKAVYCALFTGTIISMYTICDGFGARLSGNVYGYISWLFIFNTVPFSLIVLYMRRKNLKQNIYQELYPSLTIGVLGATAYATIIWALTYAPMAYVSALRETSVILAVWIGCKLLNEPFGIRRIFASVLIVIGVFILQLS